MGKFLWTVVILFHSFKMVFLSEIVCPLFNLSVSAPKLIPATGLLGAKNCFQSSSGISLASLLSSTYFFHLSVKDLNVSVLAISLFPRFTYTSRGSYFVYYCFFSQQRAYLFIAPVIILAHHFAGGALSRNDLTGPMPRKPLPIKGP